MTTTSNRHQSPTSDDLLALLSIFRSCRRPNQPKRDNVTSRDDTSWIESISTKRNRVGSDLSNLGQALDNYRDSRRSSGHRFHDSAQLFEVENAAFALRQGMEEYWNSIPIFKTLLSELWEIAYDPAETRIRYDQIALDSDGHMLRVGKILASQLIQQIKWDRGLLKHAVVSFLEDELYSEAAVDNKIRIYADAMSSMIEIDTEFWRVVENEISNELGSLQGDCQVENYGESYFIGSGVNMSLSLLASNDDGQDGDANNTEPNNLSQINLHERIISSSSVEDAIDNFLSKSESSPDGSKDHSTSTHNQSITSILLVGEEGCGKTLFLNATQRRVIDKEIIPRVQVIRPQFSKDLIGNTVGSSEDRWVSLFSYSLSKVKNGTKLLILLDDVHTILSLNYGDDFSTQFQIGRRCKGLFLSILDVLRDIMNSKHIDKGHLLLLCTSRIPCDEIAGRFDRIFTMGSMDEAHRQRMIVSCLTTRIDSFQNMSVLTDEALTKALSLVVQHSAGRTAFELSQRCRDVILAEASVKNHGESTKNDRCILEDRLHRLDQMMQSNAPQSLRGGLLDGVVDMVVYTTDELVSMLETDADGEATFPLLGLEAKSAFDSLMNVVITPLCHSERISALLNGGSNNAYDARRGNSSKFIRIGALLTGGPGVGKTSLAYYCSSLAAKTSRVTLLDVSCTSLIHKEIGGSERAVHRLFAAVRTAAPCILLLDGIENVAPRRGHDSTSEGTMDRVLSTFLTEMDGIDNEESNASGNVAVIGITHDPMLIDPSLLRPGRLEKIITLGPPDFEARRELVLRFVEDLAFDFPSRDSFDPKNKEDISQYVAMESVGMSAVETISICQEASLECLRELNFDIEDSMTPCLRYEHFRTAVKIMRGKNVL